MDYVTRPETVRLRRGLIAIGHRARTEHGMRAPFFSDNVGTLLSSWGHHVLQTMNTVSGLLLWPLYASCNRHRKQQQQQQQSVQQRTPSAHRHLEHSDLIELVQGQDPGYQQHPARRSAATIAASKRIVAGKRLDQPANIRLCPDSPTCRRTPSSIALYPFNNSPSYLNCIHSKYAWQTSKMPSGCLTQYTGYCNLIGRRGLDWMARSL